MQEAENSNVVQFRNYAPRRSRARPEISTSGLTAVQPGAVLSLRRGQVLYPGGIDDIPT